MLAALARELADGPERDPVRAREHARQAVDAARTAGDPRALATALFAQHDVEWAPGTARRRLALADEMVTAAVDADAAALEFEGAMCRFVALLELADPTAATALRQAADAAGRSRLPRARYLVRSREAAWALLQGRFQEGTRLSGEAAALAEAIGEPDGAGWPRPRGSPSPWPGGTERGRAGPRGVRRRRTAPEFLPQGRCFAHLAAGRPRRRPPCCGHCPRPRSCRGSGGGSWRAWPSTWRSPSRPASPRSARTATGGCCRTSGRPS
ncbi:hypothetical protein O1L60_37050 [Streptomyces diastatochromogenes]|nr:hypothetical protein [Streptomyces diastatochromogenes]